MDKQEDPGLWGSQFHFLPFVSIVGASTIGAVNASMSLARDGVSGSAAALFLVAWGVMTCGLLFAANHLFSRKQIFHALTASAVRRTASGASCMLVTLLGVYATYTSVQTMSGANAQSVMTASVEPAVRPAPAKAAATKTATAAAAQSVHYQSPGQPYGASAALPAPIAPPAGVLLSLPAPAVSSETSELAAVEPSEPVNLVTPERKAKPAKKRRKRSKSRSQKIAKKPGTVAKKTAKKPSGPVKFETVDSASAPAPERQIEGLTTEKSQVKITGKSEVCASGMKALSVRACRELGIGR